MDRETFFKQVQEILEVDDPIDASTDLTSLEEYDSLGILNLMTMFEEMGIDTSPQTFEEIVTGADLVRVANGKVDG